MTTESNLKCTHNLALFEYLSKLTAEQFKIFFAALVHYWAEYKFFISKQNFYNLWCELNFACHEMDESFPDQYDDREAVKEFCHYHPYYFIDRLPMNLVAKLFADHVDEPGCFLHVNAQKELISLFGHLADQGNQVVYTTHSPYMLDTVNDGIHRIRAVVKDFQGYTRIYKTAYDNRISPDSVHDTLAPIISALGMNMNDTFGPAKDKINIVTEGTSDYIYMCMMAKLLGINAEKYAIIPSQGASNCVNICAILHGWGCRYIAVFDYDSAGVETGAKVMQDQLIYDLNRDYCFMNDVTQEEIDSRTYKTAKFMVEDVITREEINRFCEEKGISPQLNKALIAKKMSNAIEKGEFTLGETAKNNVQVLFARILSYV